MRRVAPGSLTAATGLVALCWPALGWACSGPGAAEAMQRARYGGWGLALLTGIAVLGATVLVRRRGLGLGSVAAGWVLVAVHPGLWLGVDGGDCGQSRLEGSVLFACMGVALAMWSFWRPHAADPEAPVTRS
jgi:hypothetical protein